MQSAPLVEWPEPIMQLIGFVGSFLAAGAVGARYSAFRGLAAGAATDESRLYADASRRAAVWGLVGALISLVLLFTELPAQVARAHAASTMGLLTSDAAAGMQAGFLLLAVIGFALAIGRLGIGWALAAIGVILGALRAGLLGQWSRLVNPVHVLAAGLWIGTLFVMLVAGITAVLRDEPLRERRGALVADMVNRFSPVALTMGGLVVLMGVITAWRHLHVLSNLWSTPYGIALMVKLVFVAIVFALGAWNWRRQRPTLGSAEAALSIRRSSTTELGVAGVVLIVTALLVSIRPPRPPGAPAGGGGGAGGPPPTAPTGAPPGQ